MKTLRLADLTVERGGRAVVKQVSVEIPAGQVTALLGPNGAGKSTLVLAVGGVLKPKAGSVLVNDTEITGRRPERIRLAGVAIVPEGRRLLRGSPETPTAVTPPPAVIPELFLPNGPWYPPPVPRPPARR